MKLTLQIELADVAELASVAKALSGLEGGAPIELPALKTAKSKAEKPVTEAPAAATPVATVTPVVETPATPAATVAQITDAELEAMANQAVAAVNGQGAAVMAYIRANFVNDDGSPGKLKKVTDRPKLYADLKAISEGKLKV